MRFEDLRVRVDQHGEPRSAIFFNCKVRVTDRRIIIAQKIPFRKGKYQLRHVSAYNDPSGRGADLGKSLSMGVLTGSTPLDQITREELNGKAIVRIPLGGGVLTDRQSVIVYAHRPDEMMAAMRRP